MIFVYNHLPFFFIIKHLYLYVFLFDWRVIYQFCLILVHKNKFDAKEF